jgi:hypothetical protein
MQRYNEQNIKIFTRIHTFISQQNSSFLWVTRLIVIGSQIDKDTYGSKISIIISEILFYWNCYMFSIFSQCLITTYGKEEKYSIIFI